MRNKARRAQTNIVYRHLKLAKFNKSSKAECFFAYRVSGLIYCDALANDRSIDDVREINMEKEDEEDKKCKYLLWISRRTRLCRLDARSQHKIPAMRAAVTFRAAA